MPTPLDLGTAHLLAVSASGELAILKDPVVVHAASRLFRGTLARAELSGSAARELIEDVYQAEWSPDGEQLAIVREHKGVRRLEFPPGTTLYETRGHIRCPRFSPNGERIAFLDHSRFTDDRGSVAVVDLQGNRDTLSTVWKSVQTLAWSPSGDEVWLAPLGTQFVAITLDGRSRVIARPRTPDVDLFDVSPTGKVLLSRVSGRYVIRGLGRGETRERNLSWLDYSIPVDISADGTQLLFIECSDAMGPDYAVTLRGMDASAPVKLGPGYPRQLSPDGGWALTSLPDVHDQIILLPTGPGEPRVIPLGDIALTGKGRFFPDGERILFSGGKLGEAPRSYTVSVDGNDIRPITREGHLGLLVSPDGQWIAAVCPDGGEVHPVNGGEARPIRGLRSDDAILQWSTNGRSLFVRQGTEFPARVFLLDLETGKRVLWKELAPEDRVGVVGATELVVNPDGTAYAYGFARFLSELYVAEGLQ